MTSPASNYIAVVIGFESGARYVDACVQQTDGNAVPLIMVWGAFHVGGKSDLVIVESLTGARATALALGKGHLS